VAREQTRVAGTERDCVVVELRSGVTVTLPLESAAERLRAVSDEAELKGVGTTLAAKAADRSGPWAQRLRESQAKLASGRVTALAELVRDGARVEQRLSHQERRIYLQARELLVGELCSARGLERDEADAWLEAQVARGNED
jgi:CarD family transcriptional regulator